MHQEQPRAAGRLRLLRVRPLGLLFRPLWEESLEVLVLGHQSLDGRWGRESGRPEPG